MRVIELDRGGGLIAEALARARASDPPRTGVHVGTVVSDMMQAMPGARTPSVVEDKTRHAWYEVGNVVEDIIAAGLRERIKGWTKPLPRTVRGLIGSPDGHSPASRTIDEIKATWKSERGFLDSLKFLGYVLQSVTYAEMFEAERVRLHVLFINGTYTPPFPNPRTFVLRFTKAERRERFDQVRQHAVDRGWLKAA